MSAKNGNTSALKRHAELYHPDEWKEINEKCTSQTKITSQFKVKPESEIKKYPLKSKERQRYNRLLVRFIAKDLRPLYTITKKGFKDLLFGFDPRYVVPTRKTLRNKLIPELHAETLAKIHKELDETKHCCLTTDGKNFELRYYFGIATQLNAFQYIEERNQLGSIFYIMVYNVISLQVGPPEPQTNTMPSPYIMLTGRMVN